MALPHYTAGASLSLVTRFLVDQRRWERYEKKSVPNCSAVIAVNDEMRARLISIGVRPERVAVVENFVDLDRFLTLSASDAHVTGLEDRFVITYVGGFAAHRGLETALAAMPAVTRAVPSALLLLVGDGTNRGELEAISGRLGLDPYVRFEGWVDFGMLPTYLAHSDVGIVPATKNVQTDASLPHKLFQYMLMGKPVVASACMATSRVVRDADCGLLYPPGDSDALADALIQLTDPAVRAQLGGNGRRAVHDGYNWSVSASKMLAMYDRMQRRREPLSSSLTWSHGSSQAYLRSSSPGDEGQTE
jgi:glycosyltransferase involved in cell wall biosynthesis